MICKYCNKYIENPKATVCPHCGQNIIENIDEENANVFFSPSHKDFSDNSSNNRIILNNDINSNFDPMSGSVPNIVQEEHHMGGYFQQQQNNNPQANTDNGINTPYGDTVPYTITNEPQPQFVNMATEQPMAWLQVLCVQMPILGLIIYLIKRGTNENLAKSYGKLSLWSMIFGIIASICIFLFSIFAVVFFGDSVITPMS